MTPRQPGGWKNLVAWMLAGLGVFALAAWMGLNWFLHHQADHLVQSEAFRRMIEQATDKGLKLSGHYGPLRRDGTWTVTCSSFQSVGRPGEAIAFLDAEDIRATFDPWGVLRRQWTVSRIDIGHARMGLRAPDDALKIPFPEGRRPWFAFLLPTRFVPVVTACPRTDLSFAFLGHEATASGMFVEVFPYGTKDWRIVGKGGILSMRLLPPLEVRNVEFITARTFLDFQNFLLLSPPGQGFSRVEGRARLGMHEDDSLRFSVRLSDLPLTYALPGDLGQAISGVADGWVTYHRPGATRSGEDGAGQIVVRNLVIERLPVQETIAKFTGHSGFNRLEFERLSCSFQLQNGTFTIPSLRLLAPGLIDMAGRLRNSPEGEIHLDMTLADFPLKRWLPSAIQDHVRGKVQGRFLAGGRPEDLRQLHAWTFLELEDGLIDRLPLLQPLYQGYQIQALRRIRFDRAEFEMAYSPDLWELTSFSLKANQLVETWGYASLSAAGPFRLFTRIKLPRLQPLLPPAWQAAVSGSAQCGVEVRGTSDQSDRTSAVGSFDAAGLTLKRLRAQTFLARFFQDPTWLQVRFEQLSGNFSWQAGVMRIQNFYAEVPGKLALSGWIEIGPRGELSGQVKLGCGSQIIGWLGATGPRLFPLEKNRLRWTPVQLSGTVKAPENDLLPRLRSAMMADPGLFLKALLKAVSWVLGDWFNPDGFEPKPDPDPVPSAGTIGR